MESNHFLNTIENFRRVAEKCQIHPDLIERLSRPRETVKICLTPLMSDGRVHIHTAYIAQHNRALGPAKGGIRMAPSVTLDDISALAMEMTWKTSLIGVPFGGGKSGIVADPESLSPQDKEILIRSFTRSAIRHIGPEIYIPAPDMGTNERDMGHIRDCISYSSGISVTRGCYVTGKPVLCGGIPGRREATGKGVAITVGLASRLLGIDLAQARVAIQGFGNVGAVAAQELFRRGLKIIALADIHGTIWNPSGLDVDGIQEHLRGGNSLATFPGSEPIPSSELFSLDCDILVPAASSNQITPANAENIKARLIAEGANGPTTPEADQILRKKGIFIIPDILCNAGGVFVSYLEYTQETQREQMTVEEVENRLQQRLEKCFEEVFSNARAGNIEMRSAALEIAIRRVADAIVCHGFYP